MEFQQKEVEEYFTRFIQERSAPPVRVLNFGDWRMSGDRSQVHSYKSTVAVTDGKLNASVEVQYELYGWTQQAFINDLSFDRHSDLKEVPKKLPDVWFNLVLPPNLATVKFLRTQN